MDRATGAGSGTGAPRDRPALPGRADRDGPRVPGGAGPARQAAAVALLAVAIGASALAGPWTPTARREFVAAPEPLPPEELSRPVQTTPFTEALRGLDVEPWDLTVLGVVLAALLVGLALVVAARWLRRRPRARVEGAPDPADVVPGDLVSGPPGAAPHVPTLQDGLDDARDELRSALPPADAVIAAWVRLEEAAGRSGVERDPAWTPTEFTVTVLDRTTADREATRTLLDLYLRARFGTEPMTDDDVTAAAVAVEVLARTLPPADGGEG